MVYTRNRIMPANSHVLKKIKLDHAHAFQDYSLGKMKKVDDAFSALGLQEYDITDTLVINKDMQKNLNSDLAQHSAITPKTLITQDLEQYKSWIGRDDTGIDDTQWDLPTMPWSNRRISSINELTSEEVKNIEKAGWAYLFGNSSLVKGYRGIIEFCNTPFEVSIYAARKVIVKSGGMLIISGMPAILLVDELEMHASSKLAIYTVCKANIGTLHTS